jgi:hypothetical protein
VKFSKIKKGLIVFKANKYFVLLSLQSDPSADQGHFKILDTGGTSLEKPIIHHSLNTHITQLSQKTSNQQWPIREQT